MTDIDHSSYAYSHRPSRAEWWKRQEANRAQVDEWLMDQGLPPEFRSGRYHLEAPGERTVVYYPATGYWGMLDLENHRKVNTIGKGDGTAFLVWYQDIRSSDNG